MQIARLCLSDVEAAKREMRSYRFGGVRHRPVFIWSRSHRLPSDYVFLPNLNYESQAEQRRPRDYTLFTATFGRQNRYFAVFERRATPKLYRLFFELLLYETKLPLAPCVLVNRPQSARGLQIDFRDVALLLTLEGEQSLIWERGNYDLSSKDFESED